MSCDSFQYCWHDVSKWRKPVFTLERYEPKKTFEKRNRINGFLALKYTGKQYC